MIDQTAGGVPGQSGGTSATGGTRTLLTAAERPLVPGSGLPAFGSNGRISARQLTLVSSKRLWAGCCSTRQ